MPTATATASPSAKGLAAREVDVRVEELRLPVGEADVADEEIVLLQGDPHRAADGALRSLAHDELEGLVAAEVHLLGVAVGARVGQLPVEAEEDGEPALVRRAADRGGDADQVDGAVHRLVGAEEDALPEPVVGARRRGQVDREVWHRAVLGRDRPRDDAVDPDVSGQVPIGLLEQLAREVQLGLGHPLSEVEIGPVGHARSAPLAPRGQTARRSSRGLAPRE